MKNPLFIAVALVILAVFVVNMTTWQLDFTEKAVVATFGEVADTGVKEEPGLKFKLPAPIQTVTVYDRRARVLTVENRQGSTRDDGTLVADAFLTWRVSDPREFYRTFSSQGAGADTRRQYESAEETLSSTLGSELQTALGEFSLDELFPGGGASSALPNLERRVLERVQQVAGTAGGFEVQTVGISRLVFPENVSEQVIGRMAEFRNSIAENAQQEGESEAQSIIARADADAKRILAFANTRAAQVRSEGERDAARWWATLSQNPELAKFLAYTNLWGEQGIGRTLTLVLPLSSFGGEFFSPEYRERVIEAGKRASQERDAGKESGDNAGGRDR